MSRPVRLEVDLVELHEAIAESIRIALAATGHRIVDAAGADDTAKVREMARNAAGGLMLFAVDDEREAA